MPPTTQPAKFVITSPISFGEAARTFGRLWSEMFSTHPITTILFGILVLGGIFIALTSPPAKKRR